MKAEQEYDIYFQETADTLQSLSPADFSPSLDHLDSIVKTIFVHAAGGAGPNPEMLGVTWKWQSFNGIAVPKPDLFTLVLQPDGTFQFTADCNTGGGTYIADDVQITFTFGEMSQNDCGRESLSTVFVKMLPSALTYILNESDLTFKLTGSGSMVFAK